MIKSNNIILSIIILTVFMITVPRDFLHGNGNGKTEFKYSGEIKPGRWNKISIDYNFEGKASSVPVRIYFPKNYKRGDRIRTIILLHGFRDNYLGWGRNTRIEYYANSKNFALVCPNMGKTSYETKFYPETSYKWGIIPGGKFVGEILIKHLRENFALASSRGITGILGSSTGGRGALLIAAVYHDLFSVASGLSGFYNHTIMKKNKTLISIYGEFNSFEDRWKNDDNIMNLAKNLMNTDIFLYHGASDYTYPKEQSLIFAIRLGQLKKKLGGKLNIKYKHRKFQGHDWKFWNKSLSEVMNFFDKHLVGK